MHRAAQRCAFDELRRKAAERLKKAERELARALGQDPKSASKKGKVSPAAAAAASAGAGEQHLYTPPFHAQT